MVRYEVVEDFPGPRRIPPVDQRSRIRYAGSPVVIVRSPEGNGPGMVYPVLPPGYPQVLVPLDNSLLKHIYSPPRYLPQTQLVVSPEIGLYSGAFPVRERSGIPTSEFLLPRDRNFTAKVLDIPMREPLHFGNPIPNVFP